MNRGSDRPCFLAAVLLVALSCTREPAETSPSGASDAILRERVTRILAQVPLIDGHNDVPWAYRERVQNDVDAIDFAGDTGALEKPMHTDLKRLRAGGVGAQFWSVYIPTTSSGPGAAREVLEQIDFVHRLVGRHPDHLEMACGADDIERIHRHGRIASLIGIEGGHSIENSLAVLRMLHGVGARYMTIAHSRNTDFADSATDDQRHGGLTEFGREVIREMNRLGMLVDLSHVAAKTMHDALDVARAPVIFSHSSARAITDHPRNVPDDVLRRVKENGGVVMVTFVPPFVNEQARQHYEQRKKESERLESAHGGDKTAVERDLEQWKKLNPAPRATLADVVRHIDHIRALIGAEHLGIGGDYDGVDATPQGLEDVSKYPDLLVELLRRGYSDSDLRAIAGQNLLRVLRSAEQLARDLHRQGPPSHKLLSPLKTE